MKPVWRRVTGAVAVLALVFSQIVMAAYTCAAAASPASAASMEANVSMPGDDGVDNPGLCIKHCQDEPQKTPDAYAAAFPVAFVPLYWTAIAIDASPQHLTARSPSLLHAPPLALSIRNCCFRI